MITALVVSTLAIGPLQGGPSSASADVPLAERVGDGSVVIPSSTGPDVALTGEPTSEPARSAAATTPPATTDGSTGATVDAGAEKATVPSSALEASGSTVPRGDSTEARFPAAVSLDGRRLEDQHGDTWPLIGDAGWSGLSELTIADWERYLDGIAAQGFNTVMVYGISNAFTTQPERGANVEGDSPFTGAMFQSEPNEPYWGFVDRVLEVARTRGVSLLFTPLFAGYSDAEGVGAEMVAASAENLAAFGSFLGQRYRHVPNILWMVGGDRPEPSEEILARWDAFATALVAADPSALVSFHTSRFSRAALEFGDAAWLSINTAYGDGTRVAETTGDAYGDAPVRPVLYVEGRYENERDWSPNRLRTQIWGSFSAGAIGNVYGNSPRWHFDQGGVYGNPPDISWIETIDPSNPDSRNTRSVKHFADLVASIAWGTTVPDREDLFLVDGERTGEEQAAARFSSDLAVVYLPTARTVRLNLTDFDAETVQITRLDPVDGSRTTLGEYTTTGVAEIDAQGPNSGGDTDWVLMVETLAGAPDAGLLRVTTEPAVPARIFVDGVPRNDWGLEWVSFDPGSHEVCFSDVPGFATPACQTVDVTSGETTVVVGEFTPLGLLKADAEPAGIPTTVYVDGEPRNEYGLYAFTEPGRHTVCWGDVPGFGAPPCQTVEVVGGEQQTIAGLFTAAEGAPPGPVPPPDDFGYLRVATQPSIASRVIVDGITRSDWGLNGVKVPIGEHEVCFTDVVGFTAPACRTVLVESGTTVETVGEAEQLGLLKIEVSPAGLPVDVLVDGEPRNQFGAYLFLEAGTYEVCGTDIDGSTTPACVQAVVDVGVETTSQLIYRST